MAAEAIGGNDLFTGQRIENDWAHAGLGALNLGLSTLGIVEAGVTAGGRIGAMPTTSGGGSVPGPTAAASTGGTLAGDLAAAATRAKNTVGPGRGGAYGTRVHSAFEAEIEALNRPNVRTEVSYLNGVEVYRGKPGSVRLDVVEFGPNGQILNVYDLKTGSAKLTQQRIQQIQNAVRAPVPVHLVRP